MKKALITIFKFGLSFAILTYFFLKAKNEGQISALWSADNNWGWLGVALVAVLGAHFVSFYRWKLLVRALGIPFALRDAVRIGLIGTFFNLLSLGVIGGDSLRAYYAARESKDKIPEAIASVVLDRVIGLLTMVSCAAAGYLLVDFSQLNLVDPELFDKIQVVCKFALLASASGIAGFLIMFLVPQITRAGWYLRLMELPKVGGTIRKLTDMIEVYRSKPGTILNAFGLSVIVNVCFVITIYSIAAGIAQSYPSFTHHFVIEPISMVANAAPLPGGIGAMEAALEFLYKGFSTDSEAASQGFIVGLAFRFFLLLISALGAIAWFLNRKQLKEIVSEESDKADVTTGDDTQADAE